MNIYLYKKCKLSALRIFWFFIVTTSIMPRSFGHFLAKLKEGKQYFYVVLNGSESSKVASFTTYKTGQSNIHFVAMGDSRSNPDIFRSIIDNLQQDEPDFIISMGDLVASGGNYTEWDKYYFDIAGNVISSTPLVSTLGDHEGDDDEGELLRHFLRTNQPAEKLWFSFDYGDAHFVSLDYRHPASQEMTDWFVKDMANTKARWNFVYFHRPTYNLGGHRSMWGRDTWPALFSEHKVDIVFAGHSHLYERFFPMKSEMEHGSWPVTYITTGGAGAGLYDITKTNPLAVAESVNHFVDIKISSDELKLMAIRKDGSLLDDFEIVKKGAGHDAAYNALVQSQEGVNLITHLTGAMSSKLQYMPFRNYVAPHIINLKSNVNTDLPFRIELENESTSSCKMEPFEGILKANQELEVPLEVFSLAKSIAIDGWGDMTPALKLKIVYTFNSKEEIIIGGALRYWPSTY